MESELLNAISTVGFPIVSFFAMFYLIRTTMRENTSAINQLKETLIKLIDNRSL